MRERAPCLHGADRAGDEQVVLVTATPTTDCNHALVIREMLQVEYLSR